MKRQNSRNRLRFANVISKISVLSCILISQVTNANSSTDFIQQIVDGHSYRKENVHGSQINVLESTAYQRNYYLHLRKLLQNRIIQVVSPYIEEQNQLAALVESGNATQEQRSRLAQIEQKIESIKSRDYVLNLHQEIKEYEDQNMDYYCYDNQKTTLRLMKGEDFDVRCIDNQSAQRIVDVATNDPQKANEISVETSSGKAPQPEGKLYFCYQRDKSILTKSKSCNPKKVRLTDDELEKVGKSNCYPINQNYTYNEADGFTPIARLYSRCRDEICTNATDQIDFENFQMISFSQNQAGQCLNDNSESRVCAQTYTCQNKTYQVTCQFDDEKPVDNNKCNVQSINEDTIMNKCTIVELGTEV